ncbi:MAG: amino acid adenylation domain-containing protein, partial [Thermoanaerobaculia bacterium]
MTGTPFATVDSPGPGPASLPWAQLRAGVRKRESEALSAVSAACAQPADTVFLTAVALTLYRYGSGGSVSVLAPSQGEERGEGRIVEVALTPSLTISPTMTVRQLVAHVAEQWRAARPPACEARAPRNAETGLPEVFRADLQRCLVAPAAQFAARAVADGDACIAFTLCAAVAKASVAVHYRADLLDRRLAGQLARHVLRTLSGMAGKLDHPVACCAILSPGQRQRIVDWARGPVRDYPLQGGLKDLFERRARSAPDAVALVDEGGQGARSIRYGELNRFADALAHELRQAGIRQGSRVAVALRRSIESVGALLAIIKTGAVFVPLDDSYPEAYVRRILQEVAPGAVLAAPEDAERLAGVCAGCAGATLVPVRWPQHQAEAYPDPEGAVEADADFLILYTSGSTGQPKGVVHRQRQVLNRLYWMWEAYPFAAGEVMCQRSPLTVMPSIWELLGGLLRGVPTVIASREVARDPACMTELVARHGVTRMTLLPSLLLRLLEREGAEGSLACLRAVTVGGEMAPGSLYRTFRRKLQQCVLIEDYGCTEVNTIWHEAVGARDAGVEASPGGRPIANLGAYVLDRCGHLAPPGLIGEVTVAGGSLAAGYVGCPGAYEERFVENTVDPSMGPLLYRTGDLAYYRFSGTLELVGRADHQMKIRGIRVEPSEIEEALARHEAVDECCAVCRPDPRDGDELVVFLVPRQGARIGATELRAFLSERLPSFMIPNRVLV